MAYYDQERLNEEANSQIIADYLGIESEIKGSRTWIKCPGHFARMGKEDRNFGNCVLTEHGYHCFACNKIIHQTQMVMEFADCDYNEALGIIGDALGGRENYLLSGDVLKQHTIEKALSAEDLELIGLVPNVSIDIVESLSNDKKQIVQDELIPVIPSTGSQFDFELYCATTHKSYSIRLLKNEDPETYYRLIRQKAKESMDKYQKMIEICERSSEQSKILLPLCETNELNEEVLYDFKHLFMDMYNRCKEIYFENGAEETEEAPTIEEPKIPKYNLFG